MKIVTEEESKQVSRVILVGGATGFVIGLSGAVVASLLLQRFSAGYRKYLTFPLKIGLITAATSCATVIQAERDLLRYDRARYSATLSTTPTTIKTPTIGDNWRSSLNSILDKVESLQWEIIGGTWLVGMAWSGARLYRNKHLNVAQKVVQARMIAQALTISVLLATALLAMRHGTADLEDGWRRKKHSGELESWQLVLQQQEQQHRLQEQTKIPSS